MTSLYKSMVYQKYRGILISLYDITVVFFSYVFGFFFDNDFFLNGGMLHITRAIILGMCFVLLLHAIMGIIFQTHKSLWTFTGPSEVIRAALKSISCLVIMLIFSYSAGLFLHTQILVMAETISFFICLGSRLVYRSFRRYALDMERNENALIVGAGNAGYLMLSEIYRGSSYPYNVIGFLDDMKEKGTIVNGKKVLGTVDDVKEVCAKYDVKHVFIAISKATRQQKQRIIDLCASSGANTKIMRFTTESDLNSPVHVEDIQIEDLLERPSINLENEQIGSYLCDKVVCVTGAGGSIGSELVRQILKFDPKTLVLLDINENTLYMLKQEILRGIRQGKYRADVQLETLIVSIRERDEIFKMVAKYNGITTQSDELHYTTKNSNYYFRFQQYGRSFKIQLFHSGDIYLIFKETINGEMKIHLYPYNEEDTVEEILPYVKNIIKYFIKDWYKAYKEYISYHDFVNLGDDCFDYKTPVKEIKDLIKKYAYFD